MLPCGFKVLGKWGGVKDPPLHPHVTLGKWVVLSALPTKGVSARSSVVLELPCAQEPPGMRV